MECWIIYRVSKDYALDTAGGPAIETAEIQIIRVVVDEDRARSDFELLSGHGKIEGVKMVKSELVGQIWLG